tara:strand:+ start:248 stop:1801 length:1554 start_codon:yes stop_codon:yes gene_type:complete
MSSFATVVESEINFMGSNSYKVSALDELKMLSASSMIGEDSYYQTGSENFENFRNSLQQALDQEYKNTINFIPKLRNDFLMRKSPQIIFVEACLHKNRKEFNEKNPKYLKNIGFQIIKLPTDIQFQLSYYKFVNGSIQRLPTILKNIWASYLENMSKYQAVKYLNKAKIVDLIRLSHPNPKKNDILTNIVYDKNIELDDYQETWEKLRSIGSKWIDIISKLGTKFPHMALLRNLNGISKELDSNQIKNVMNKLVDGVEHGKQFPYAYYVAYKKIKVDLISQIKKRDIILDGLENCMQESIKNFPKLNGFVTSLCDNSGSAHGAVPSSYGSVKVSEIGNLSGLITAMSSTEGGEVAVFGDDLKIYPVNKNRKIMDQLEEICALGKIVGEYTENGIWIWFEKGFNNKNFNEKTDHLFIYSDQQAGDGELYGLDEAREDFVDFLYKTRSERPYIDVLKLVEKHRKEINEKITVFPVQIAAYKNSVIPKCTPYTALLYGWTGKEVLFAKKYIEIWEQIKKI